MNPATGAGGVHAELSGVGGNSYLADCLPIASLPPALKLDMAEYWQPTAAGYFSRVSKEQTLAAIEEACGASAKSGYATLKKAALAEATEAKLKGSRWLPGLLRVA